MLFKWKLTFCLLSCDEFNIDYKTASLHETSASMFLIQTIHMFTK